MAPQKVSEQQSELAGKNVTEACADQLAETPRACSRMRTLALAPIRVAPALTMFFKSSRLRMPPAALTPTSFPTTARISATSSAVAPAGPKPVEVFTKSAPAFLLATQARTFSSRVSRSEEHTSELQSRPHLVCRLLHEKKDTDVHALSADRHSRN